MKKLIALSLALLLFVSFAPSVLAAHVHQWTQYSRVEPTCTQPGRVVYVCSCGTRKTESIPAPGHIYSNKVYINYADCTHYGSFYWVCERCGAHSDTGKPVWEGFGDIGL
jgi:mannan endo-1,4-beta-mannosidase